MFGYLFSLFVGRLCVFLKVSDTAATSFPPPLSPEAERQCFLAARAGDKKARETLIEHNLRLVAHIVKKYYASGCSQEDLMSLGTIGLIKAIDSYKPESGVKFATYAGKCLQNEILMFFRSQRKLQNEVSLSEQIDVDKEGNPLTYSDIIATEDTIADDIDRRIKTAKAMTAIRQCLSPRERQIIVLRYGLSGQKALPQREIAEKLGISRSYVSRIEKAALEKIRERMR